MWILLLSATVESWILLGKEKNFPVLRFCSSSWSKNFKRRRMSHLIMYIQGLHQENETPEQLRQLRFIWHFRGEEAKDLVLTRGAKKLQEDGRANVGSTGVCCARQGQWDTERTLISRPCRVLPATPTPCFWSISVLIVLFLDQALGLNSFRQLKGRQKEWFLESFLFLKNNWSKIICMPKKDIL